MGENKTSTESEDYEVSSSKFTDDHSFEEMLNLERELGSKAYKTLSVSNCSSRNSLMQSEDKKRWSKNRPREQSSKFPVNSFTQNNHMNSLVRDPRFDSLCGDFNQKMFEKSYKFIKNVKRREKIQLIGALKSEKDPEQVESMKLLLQRMENQDREFKKKEKYKKKLISDKKEAIDIMLTGGKPHFKKKSEKKLEGVLDKYVELQTKGSVRKHIKKKNMQKRFHFAPHMLH